MSDKQKDLIREVFLRNGFTIKDGQDDLADYVYAAAHDLLLAAPAEQPFEVVGWQFHQDGKWWNGDDRIKNHRKNTEEAGLPVRDVYATPQPAEAVQGEPSRKELYKEFSEWCQSNRSYDLDCRLHTHGGPIDHGGYISDEKTRIAFAAYRAGKLLAQQPAEQPECGCCGQTVKCDDDCDAVVFGKTKQQPAPDVKALVEALECALETMENVDGANDCSRGIDAVEEALAAYRKQGG